MHVADAVIPATGGHTRLWRRSSSHRDENYGDGMRLALEAGGRLMDIELVEFHPTGMVFPEEGGGHTRHRSRPRRRRTPVQWARRAFMERYDPVRLDLSSRDRVALANYTEIAEGRAGPHGGVYLDISHLGRE